MIADARAPRLPFAEAQMEGFDAAQKKMLVVGRDSRPYMRAVSSAHRPYCTG